MPSELLAATRALVEAPSPSGDEGPALRVAERLLREAGLDVVRQEVGQPGRFNLFAARGTPRVVMTTHLDTVPGDVPVELRGDTLQGRGACDAKGPAAAMIAAAAELVRRGRDGFGVLLVVGEETTSDGAMAANALVESGELGWRPRASVLGEPTDDRWVSAHPGVVIARLAARGRAAHSSRPQDGVSAVHLLLDWLGALRDAPWPEDPELGATLLNVGRIEGGTAANVLAEEASAEIMLRSGGDPAHLLRIVRAAEPPGATVTCTCSSSAVRFAPPPAAAAAPEPPSPAPFSTDAPFLSALGRLSLYGPGSIRHAHASDERVTGAELVLARARYVAWCEAALAAPDLDR